MRRAASPEGLQQRHFVAETNFSTARLRAHWQHVFHRVYKSRAKNAQEAHEAIRPTRPDLDPDSLPPGLDPGKWGGRVE
jgi:DNA topoisomerase IA